MTSPAPEKAAPIPADDEELKRAIRAGLSGRDEVDDLTTELRDIIDECRAPHVSSENSLRQIGDRLERLIAK